MFFTRYSQYEFLSHFSRHLAAATRMGMPLHGAVGVLATEVPRMRFRWVLERVARRLEEGNLLSEAIADERLFPHHMRILIAAGEKGGALPETLDQLSEQLDTSFQLQAHLQRTWVYPGLVLLLVEINIMVFLVVALPQTTRVFTELTNGNLPPFFAVVRGLASFLAVALALLFAFWLTVQVSLSRISASLGWADWVRLHLPGFRRLHRYVEAARTCRMLGLLLSRGSTLPEAAELVAQSSGSPRMAVALRRVRERIDRGVSFSEALEGEPFPSSLVWMVSSAEHRGNLEPSLAQLARYYEDRVESQVVFLKDLMTPLTIFFVAPFIFLAVLTIYLPIFSIGRLIH